jgi:hypothetical protein
MMGWCVTAQAQRGALNLTAAAGHVRGPQAHGAAGVAMADPGPEGLARVAANAGADVDACLGLMVIAAVLVEPAMPLPPVACEVGHALELDASA